MKVIKKANPDEIYNFAALSHVQHSFDASASTFDVNAKGLIHICTSIVELGL
jgi:GDP-D-mannose dehydratase